VVNLPKTWDGILGDVKTYEDMKAEGWVSVEDVQKAKKGLAYGTTYRRLEARVAEGRLEKAKARLPSGHPVGVYRPKESK